MADSPAYGANTLSAIPLCMVMASGRPATTFFMVAWMFSRPGNTPRVMGWSMVMANIRPEGPNKRRMRTCFPTDINTPMGRTDKKKGGGQYRPKSFNGPTTNTGNSTKQTMDTTSTDTGPVELRITSSRRMLVTLATANRQTPTGGVTRPKVRVITMTTNRWMGSTPNITAGGTRMGMRINMAAMASMNMPTTTKNKKINTMMSVVFWVTEPNQGPTMTGRP